LAIFDLNSIISTLNTPITLFLILRRKKE